MILKESPTSQVFSRSLRWRVSIIWVGNPDVISWTPWNSQKLLSSPFNPSATPLISFNNYYITQQFYYNRIGMKSIFKKGKEREGKEGREEVNEFQKKKVMMTDLCPSEKQKIGEMMLLMEKQKQEISYLNQILKQERENRVIEGEKVEQLGKENSRLTERIREIEDKYIESCRDLEQEKMKALTQQKPITKGASTQTQQKNRVATEIQTEPIQFQMEQLEQTVMNIIRLEDLKNNEEEKPKLDEETKGGKSGSPPVSKLFNNSKSYRDIPLPRRSNNEECSNEKKEPSASKLAKEWIKVKKQKISKMKKDILKSERKMFKQLSITPDNTDDNDQEQSEVESESSVSRTRNMMEEYLEKARGKSRYETKASRLKTEENRHPNRSIYNPLEAIHRSNSQQKRSVEKSQRGGSNSIPHLKGNKLEIDEEALNVMLKSKVFKANDVLDNMKGKQPGSKKPENRLMRGLYSSDLIDLIQTLDC